jgi:sec-independent protein translocase protein TatA
MFGVGPMEFLIIAMIGLLLFGNRLPSVMRSLGKSVTEFKHGLQDVEDEIRSSATSSPSPSITSQSPPKENASQTPTT